MSKKQPQMLYGIIALVVLAGVLFATGIIKLPTGIVYTVGSGVFTLPSPGGVPSYIPLGLSIYGSDWEQIKLDQEFNCANAKGTFYEMISDQDNNYYDSNGNIITQTCAGVGQPCAVSHSFDLTAQCDTNNQVNNQFNYFTPKNNGTYKLAVAFIMSSNNQPIFPANSHVTAGTFQVNCPNAMIPSGQGYCYSSGAQPGTISVISTPSGALVSLDGNLIRNADGTYSNGGITPLILNNVQIGSHRLNVQFAGYYDQDAYVDVTSGQVSNINVALIASNVPSPTPVVTPPVIPAGKAAIYFDAYPKADFFFFSSGLQARTPYLVNDLPPGTYQYKMRVTGYPDFFDSITVQADQYYKVYRNFLTPTPIPSYAVLTFQSTPVGQVFLNGQQATTPYTFSSLAPGAYSYNYQLVGYDSSQGSITVEAGKSYTISHTFALPGQPTPTLQPVPKVCPSGTVCGLDGKTYVDKCTALNTSGGIQGTGVCPYIQSTVTPSPTPTANPTTGSTPTPSPTQTVTPTPAPIIGGGINLNVLGGLLVVAFAVALYYGYSKKGKRR